MRCALAGREADLGLKQAVRPGHLHEVDSRCAARADRYRLQALAGSTVGSQRVEADQSVPIRAAAWTPTPERLDRICSARFSLPVKSNDTKGNRPGPGRQIWGADSVENAIDRRSRVTIQFGHAPGPNGILGAKPSGVRSCIDRRPPRTVVRQSLRQDRRRRDRRPPAAAEVPSPIALDGDFSLLPVSIGGQAANLRQSSILERQQLPSPVGVEVHGHGGRQAAPASACRNRLRVHTTRDDHFGRLRAGVSHQHEQVEISICIASQGTICRDGPPCPVRPCSWASGRNVPSRLLLSNSLGPSFTRNRSRSPSWSASNMRRRPCRHRPRKCDWNRSHPAIDRLRSDATSDWDLDDRDRRRSGRRCHNPPRRRRLPRKRTRLSWSACHWKPSGVLRTSMLCGTERRRRALRVKKMSNRPSWS